MVKTEGPLDITNNFDSPTPTKSEQSLCQVSIASSLDSSSKARLTPPKMKDRRFNKRSH